MRSTGYSPRSTAERPQATHRSLLTPLNDPRPAFAFSNRPDDRSRRSHKPEPREGRARPPRSIDGSPNRSSAAHSAIPGTVAGPAGMQSPTVAPMHGHRRLEALSESRNQGTAFIAAVSAPWFEAMCDLADQGPEGLSRHLRDPCEARSTARSLSTCLTRSTAALPWTVMWAAASIDDKRGGPPLIGALRTAPDICRAAFGATRITEHLMLFHRYTDGAVPICNIPELLDWAQHGCTQPSASYTAAMRRAEAHMADFLECMERRMGPRDNGWDRELTAWIGECAVALRDARSAYLSCVSRGDVNRFRNDLPRSLEQLLSRGPSGPWAAPHSMLSWRDCLFVSSGPMHHLMRRAGEAAGAVSRALSLRIGADSEPDVLGTRLRRSSAQRKQRTTPSDGSLIQRPPKTSGRSRRPGTPDPAGHSTGQPWRTAPFSCSEAPSTRLTPGMSMSSGARWRRWAATARQ